MRDHPGDSVAFRSDVQRMETIRLRDECLVALLCCDTVRISLFAITSHVYTVTGCTA